MPTIGVFQQNKPFFTDFPQRGEWLLCWREHDVPITGRNQIQLNEKPPNAGLFAARLVRATELAHFAVRRCFPLFCFYEVEPPPVRRCHCCNGCPLLYICETCADLCVALCRGMIDIAKADMRRKRGVMG